MSETLSEECLRAFLDSLAETSNVSLAAKRAGVSRSAVYRLRATDPAFRQGWQAAIATSYDELEFRMLKHARFGVKKPCKRGDGTMGRVTEYDDAQGLKLLMAYKTNVEKGQADVTGDVIAASAAREQLAIKVEQIRQRLDRAVGEIAAADQDPAGRQ